MFEAQYGNSIIDPDVVFTNSLAASWPVCKLSSLQVIQSAN